MTKGTPAIFPELRGSIAGLRWPCFAEIKYDGEATLIGYHDIGPTPIFTCNKYGTMRQNWSKLDEIMDILKDNDVERAVFLAELYHGDGKKGALYKLLSNKDSDDLNLTIYDIGHLHTKTSVMPGETTPLITRKEILGEILSKFAVRPHIVENKLAAEAYFQCITNDGYEGIVLKPFDGFLVRGPCSWVKMKFKDRTNYLVVEVSSTQERIEIIVPVTTALIVPVTTALGGVRVGVKVTNKHKKNIQVGDWVEIEHQGVLESGSLRHPVYIGKKERKE